MKITKKKVVVIIVLLFVVGFGIYKFFSAKETTPQYQTAKVEKGTLVVSISASGQVSAANSASINTQASGVVSQIYVQNDQYVETGDKIAEIELDLEGQQRSSQAFSSYQSAKNSLDSAKNAMLTLQSDMFTKWDTFKLMAEGSKYQNADGSPRADQRYLAEFNIADDNWLASEEKFKNQEKVIAQAQTSLNSAWLSYQQSSSTVYAPISGVVSGLSLQIGSVLNSQSNTSGTATSQKIASVKTAAAPVATINLTEIDVPKVKSGNKAILTFDAFPDKTFTGRVVAVDTTGAVTSGVTTYLATISLDNASDNIYSNMAVNAKIIISVKNDVLLVPSGAISTTAEESTVRVLKNGEPVVTTVEIGVASDTQTEAISGLKEGDTIITSTASTNARSSGTTNTSPFGSMGGRGFGGGMGR